MAEAPSATPAAPPPALAALSKLSLLTDEGRNAFFAVVASQLCAAPQPAEAAAASLRDGFGLDFTSGEPAALLLGAKVLASRIASRAYQADAAKAALLADLLAAGLPQAAAEWVREAAEAAVLPCAAQLRLAQGHAAAALSADYLHDFDWQLNHVLASSSIAAVGSPLVQLQLKVRKAGTDEEVVEQLELTPAELDAAISSLGAASSALRSLAEPGASK